MASRGGDSLHCYQVHAYHVRLNLCLDSSSGNSKCFPETTRGENGEGISHNKQRLLERKVEKVYSIIYRDCWRERCKVCIPVLHPAPRRPYIVNMAKLNCLRQGGSSEYLQVGGPWAASMSETQRSEGKLVLMCALSYLQLTY